jgi:RNA polymerase I-specific transcription initiation factor RRN7
LKGPRAVDLYLKSLQLILRHQLWFLIHDRGLPAELETVVQDLWALRILQFEAKTTSQRQEFDSSQAVPATESDTDADTNPSGLESRKERLKDTPNVLDSLVLCYLGMITLRLTITPGDIYTWTTSGKLAYRRAIKLLPTPMRERLPAYYHVALDPNSLLSLERFYATLIDLEVGFEREFGVLWPSLNAPLLVWRFIKELALPVEVYDATVRLGDLLGFDWALHTEGKVKLGVRDVPEAQLVACLVVVVKLFYPFDAERRYPRAGGEAAAMMMDWKGWCAVMMDAKMGERGDEERYSVEELTKLKEKDVFDMSGEQMDQYLDFYLANFVDEMRIDADEAGDGFRGALYDMFPVGKEGASTEAQRTDDMESEKQWEIVRAVQAQMRPNAVVADGNRGGRVQRPGEGYVSWKKESSLPEYAATFYAEAARVAGLDLDMLIMAVFFVERRVEKWKMARREEKRAVGD